MSASNHTHRFEFGEFALSVQFDYDRGERGAPHTLNDPGSPDIPPSIDVNEVWLELPVQHIPGSWHPVAELVSCGFLAQFDSIDIEQMLWDQVTESLDDDMDAGPEDYAE